MNKGILLVTGASGFLGRNVSKYFSERGWKIYGIGLGKWEGRDFNSWGITEWYETEISYNFLNNLGETPNLIVHCAGSGSVGYSISNPKEDFEANVSSLLPVLEFMRLKCPKTRLIYPSSVAVYGNKSDKPIKEDDLLEPISPYGYHKKIAEELLESYSKNFNLDISIIRFFSIYGPGLKKQLLWDACEKIKSSADGKIEFFGTGNETRDWIHIKDAASLIYKLSESKNKFEILNGASGERTMTKQILGMLVKEYGKKVEVVFNGIEKSGDPKYYYGDISKAKKTGWNPEVNLEDGLREYVHFYKTNV